MEYQFTVILLPLVLTYLERNQPRGVTAEGVTLPSFCRIPVNHNSLPNLQEFRWGRLRRELQAKISTWVCATEVNVSSTIDISRFRNSLLDSFRIF